MLKKPLTKEQLHDKLENDDDFIVSIKYDNSLKKAIDDNPDGCENDKIAIENVKTELKDFLVEMLNNLMGGPQDKKKNNIDLENLSFDLPFNEMEIEFLKALALQGTKGQSASSNTATISVKPMQVVEKPRNSIKSLGRTPAPKVNSIKKVNEVRYQEPEPEYEEEYEEEDNFPPQRQVPERREAREQPVKRKSSKTVAKMTAAEIEQRNEEISREQKLKKSGIPSNAMPMPSAQVQENMVNNRASRGDAGMNAILGAVLASKNK